MHAGWGILWNSPSYGNITIDRQDDDDTTTLFFRSAATLAVDLLLTCCPAGGCDPAMPPHPFKAILQQSVAAMGFAPALPYVASGFVQSKDRYREQGQLLEVAAQYRARGLPIDMIVLDKLHWEHLGEWG
jgi:alpha-D-xyloside xylohydrolase